MYSNFIGRKLHHWYNNVIPDIERYTKEQDPYIEDTHLVTQLYERLNDPSIEQGPVLEELKTLAYLIRDHRLGGYTASISTQHEQLVAVLNLRNIYGSTRSTLIQ